MVCAVVSFTKIAGRMAMAKFQFIYTRPYKYFFCVKRWKRKWNIRKNVMPSVAVIIFGYNKVTHIMPQKSNLAQGWEHGDVEVPTDDDRECAE